MGTNWCPRMQTEITTFTGIYTSFASTCICVNQIHTCMWCIVFSAFAANTNYGATILKWLSYWISNQGSGHWSRNINHVRWCLKFQNRWINISEHPMWFLLCYCFFAIIPQSGLNFDCYGWWFQRESFPFKWMQVLYLHSWAVSL